MKKHNFPIDSFIGGWYIDEKICDNIIDYYNTNTQLHTDGLCYEGDGSKVNTEHKESKDIFISPDRMDNPFYQYRNELQNVLVNYLKVYPHCDSVEAFNIMESYNIQWYPKGGGFKKWHCERTNISSCYRHLVFMTYLNDVDDGGTEFYHQNIISPAKKGLTVIWPSDWTHTHRGVISHTKEKMIVTGWYSYSDSINSSIN